MRTLYHYRMSPFSRRVRLALAHKGLSAELRDPRENPAFGEEARRLTALRTMPVLVDDGRVVADSTAIARWLDAAYPEGPALWPREDAELTLEAATLVDATLDLLVNLGTRYYALRDSPAWPGVKEELLGRARLAAGALAGRVTSVGRPTLARGGWSAADMAVLTMVLWCEGWAARAPTSPNIAQVTSLGFELPGALARWADAHRGRADVAAL